jgi:molybdopterin converting factor small subunit
LTKTAQQPRLETELKDGDVLAIFAASGRRLRNYFW